MNRSKLIPLAFIVAWACGWGARKTHGAEPLFRDLPPGVFLESSTEATPAQARDVGQKLGGTLERIANSWLRVHGRPIQVNTLTVADDANAQTIHAAISRIKSHPAFCARQGRLVVEYVGRDIDAAFATKTSYELGLLPRPASVRYRVIAELAPVEKADYMACAPLGFFGLLRNAGSCRRRAEPPGGRLAVLW